jgi:hypothetical protein
MGFRNLLKGEVNLALRAVEYHDKEEMWRLEDKARCISIRTAGAVHDQ